MSHPLRCRCGTLRGLFAPHELAPRATCYCKDCQAFAHFLGRPDEVLDRLGGTDIVATLARNLTFTQGADSLACMSLSPKGLLRWYARCCRTPIANTVRDMKLSYVGIVHACLHEPGQTLEAAGFGPLRMVVNTKSAKGTPPSLRWGTFTSLLNLMPRVIVARFNGDHRRTPFFDAATGAPRAAVTVIGASERERLSSAP